MLFQESVCVLAVDAWVWVVLPCSWEHGALDAVGKSMEEAGTCWKNQPCRALCLAALMLLHGIPVPQRHLQASPRGLWVPAGSWNRGLSPTDGISPVFSRILDIAKALRLRVSKAKGVPGLENDQNHKLGTLSLPLPTQKAPEGQRKRKKMN